MNTINYSVVLFFILAALLMVFLGSRFREVSKEPARSFGNGLLLVALAFVVWGGIVALHPQDMQTAVTVGMLPFFISFLVFLRAAMTGVSVKYKAPIYLTNLSILTIFVVLRLFVFKSDPGFTDNGYFAFNVDALMIYFYTIITAFNFIPAIYVVGRHIKHDLLRLGMELGLTLVGVGMVVMITSKDDNLQFINGVGIIAGLLLASFYTALYRPAKYVK